MAVTEDVDSLSAFSGAGKSGPAHPTRLSLIACRVFSGAMAFLELERRHPNLNLRYLPANLHLNPHRLQKALAEAIEDARKSAPAVCCLYGNCFPDIDRTLQDLSAIRLPCGHCYEALLGRKRYERILEDQVGTFFLEKQMILNFEDHCWRPLALEDAEMREWYFSHYRQVLYIRQPMDGNLESAAAAIASRLELPLSTVDADYSDLRSHLTRALKL